MRKVLVILLLFVNSSVLAQLQITFPMNRAVFQRNNSGGGVIAVAGVFQSKLDRVDVRLVAINGGATTDWATVTINPNSGTFQGRISTWAGWYRLEVRGTRNQQIVANAQLDKVGIGEVFVIAGQSNAMGYEGFGNPPAFDDRVNVVSNYYSYGQNPDVPYPVISHLDENTKIAPLGGSSWCWGRLGDLLAARLNVPVLFFNSAMESMSVESWQVSADGGRGYDFYSGNYALPGYPYDNLRKSMYNYVTMFGARAVLWHQGETDSDKGTSFDTYKNTLQYLIKRSRDDSGKDISWVVSKVSRTKLTPSSPVIIQAQEAVIQNYPNVFNGPDTDGINTRVDGVHFVGQGLVDLANAWNERLNNDFFARSNAIPGSMPLDFNVNCNGQNTSAPLNLAMQGNYNQFYWTNGAINLNSSRNINVNSGFYRGKAIDDLGNVFYTPGLKYEGEILPPKPIITADSPINFCEGGSVNLTTSAAEDFYWNNGSTSKSITASISGGYSVSRYNFLGCTVTSDVTTVTALPKPEARIIASGPTTFCQDNSVTLRSAVGSGNLWSNGQDTPSITLNSSGEFTLKVRNELGCENTSEKVVVTVNPKPQRPNLTVQGPTVFCADASVSISSDIKDGIVWNTGASWYEILVNQTGNYFVTATNSFGCQQSSAPVAIKVNPLPAKPVISTSGPTTFCNGSSVTLSAPASVGYVWNTQSTTQSINTNTAGLFSVKVRDINGCVSVASNEVTVEVKQNPQNVTILQSGPYSLEAITTGTIDSQFEWTKDGTKLTDATKQIKARSTGAYTVRGAISYQLPTGSTLRCYSAVSGLYAYAVDPADNGTVVFPNPVTNDFVNIETLLDYRNVKATFYNLKGDRVFTFDIPLLNARKTLDVRNMPKGNYLIKITGTDYYVVKRIIIE